MNGELVARRWRRYGMDRTYISTATGESLGWRDNATGHLHVADEAHRPLVEAAIAGGEAPGAAAAATVPDDPPPPPPLRPAAARGAEAAADTYLDRNAAGQSARQRAVELKAAAPVRTTIARVLGIHTEERAWRIGAKGEEKVAAQLTKLGPDWHAIHAVPVGVNGADIDHLVIGPGGVYCLNAKHHPGAGIWVAADTFLVNGHRLPYVRNSRHEAKRASRLLSRAVGRTVTVTGVIVPVAASEVVIKQPPEGVHVVPRRRIAAWLREHPQLLDPADVKDLLLAARLPATWQDRWAPPTEAGPGPHTITGGGGVRSSFAEQRDEVR